ANPCEHGGSCHNTPGSFACHCLNGYTGSRCESDLNECLSQPCHNGASCLDLLDQFQCLCPVGFEGPQCQLEVDGCASSPCRNGGQCQNSAGTFRCICPQDPCQNGGQCIVKAFAPICLCPLGWGGSRCQQKTTRKGEPCPDLSGGGDCQCLPGKKCPDGRVCTETPSGYLCLCPPGTKGPNCDLYPCSVPTAHCYHGGTCVARPEGVSCLCPPGYVGDQCQGVVDPCFSQPCHPSGAHSCQSNANGFQCFCLPGYTGILCESLMDSCQPNPCLNGGSCQAVPDSPLEFTCHCPQHNGGVCISHPSGPQCLCSGGFSGPDCRLPPCSSGSCPAPNTTVDCQQVAGDGRCDRACSSPETRWDGGDCSLGVLDPWENCPRRDLCWMAFRDGQCHRHCDNEDCLFDGYDCSQQMQCNPLYERYCRDHFSDGHCDGGCDTALCGWDGGDCWSASTEGPGLGLVVLLPQEGLRQSLRSLAVALRGALGLQRDLQGRERIYPYTGKEELGSSSNWTGTEEKAAGETIGRQHSGDTRTKESVGGTDPQASASHFPGPLVYSVVAGVVAVVLGIFLGVWRVRRPQRREQGLLWLPPGFAPRQGKKRRCRREPVGEDAIGLKPRKSGTEFVEDSDMCSSPHFDGPLSFKDIKDDLESISPQNQGQSTTEKQVQLNMLTSDQEKNSKLKAVKTQGSVCGLTPLMPAAHTPVSKVEESWADTQEESSGETPLHLAARYSRADAARRLLASGADANTRDQWGRTPLHSAIAADALGVFQILLRHRQTDLDTSAHDGSTPLILATRLGVENMVEELVANRVDIGATDKRVVVMADAQTPLFLAAREGSCKVACLLLQHGAKQNIPDHVGRLARDVAQERLHHDILSLLDSPRPSPTAGQLPSHRPRPHHHRSAPNPRKLSWQGGHPRLPPVPENEIPLKVLPPSALPTSSSEEAVGLPPE
ncbi:PREDICTED: neurogenic locus notch homolog protein 4, partial [Gekko japonicus]|uniref:Neurogenic locus notch homolog protein 4 n=1 Tax=Gekko japonicus TaxID=146911 RepID=A0ABM1JPB5_GEKJA